MKACTKCGEFKDLEEFARRGNGYRSECKACHREDCRKHYQTNRQQYYDRNKERKAYLRRVILFYKDQPCVDCGVQYEARIMEFDHLGLSPKLANMNNLLNLGSVELIQKEIEKTEIVCPNCHKKRTYARIDKERERV